MGLWGNDWFIERRLTPSAKFGLLADLALAE
jgi:hypothetical protein